MGAYLKILGLVADLVAIFKGWLARKAGRDAAILESKEATDALIEKAVAARRDQRVRNADTASLREPDPYSRD